MQRSGFQNLSLAFSNARLLKQVGVYYLQEFGLPEVAVAHLDLALQLSPGQSDKQIESLRQAAVLRIARSTGDRQLHTTVDQPLRLKPIVSSVVRKTGRLSLSLVKQQLTDTLTRLADTAKESPPQDTDENPCSATLLLRAGQLLREGRWREALVPLESARIANAPALDLQKFYTQAGAMALSENELEQALDACVKAKALSAVRKPRDRSPVKGDAWVNVGIIYQKLGRLDDALACFVQAEKLEPTNPEILCNFSLVQFERCAFAEAEEIARKVLALFPDNFRAWDVLATVLAAVDRLSEAEEACNRAIQLNPELGSAWFKQGVIAFQQDNLGKARAAFIQSQGTSNFLPSALCYLAMIEARRGEFDSAQLKLADARKLSPPNDLLLTTLREVAFNLSQRDDLSQALKFYQEATSLHSSDFPSWLGLGAAYHRLGHLGEARHAYLEASKLEDNHPGPWHNLGLLAAEESNFGEACEYFEKEANLTPSNPKAWYDLGVSLQSLGKQEASQTAFAKVDDLLTDPIGVSGDLLTGMRIVRRTQLKKKTFNIK